MIEWLHRIGPVATLLLVFTWFCWPYITGSATTIASQEPGAIAGLAKTILSPKVQDPSTRDPFKVLAELVEDPSKAEQPAPTDAAPTDDDAKAADSDAGVKAATSFALTGTYIRGDHRMAIIGGVVYRAGQALGPSEAGGSPWVIEQILPDRVVLRRGSETKVISYDDSTSAGTADAARGQKQQNSSPSPGNPPEASSPDNLKPVTSLSELVRAVEGLQNQKP